MSTSAVLALAAVVVVCSLIGWWLIRAELKADRELDELLRQRTEAYAADAYMEMRLAHAEQTGVYDDDPEGSET